MSNEQLEALIVNIATINHKFTEEDFLKTLPGDMLSYTAVKLAAMKASLVDVKMAAHEHMLELDVELGRSKALAYAKYKAEHGSTAAQDMKYMDEDYIEAQRNYAKAKVQWERLKSIVADTHDLIDAIKSRVIDLQMARRDES